MIAEFFLVTACVSGVIALFLFVGSLSNSTLMHDIAVGNSKVLSSDEKA